MLMSNHGNDKVFKMNKRNGGTEDNSWRKGLMVLVPMVFSCPLFLRSSGEKFRNVSA